MYMTQKIFLVKRPFIMQKKSVSFFVLEILTFFYYANKISGDVIILQAKSGKN